MKKQKFKIMSQWRLTHFVLLTVCGIVLTACPTERFRHEKYECNSPAFGIAEIILNDTGVGDKAKIIGYDGESEVKILSSSKSTISAKMDNTRIEIKRDTGTVRVTRGNRYAVLVCSKSVFTM